MQVQLNCIGRNNMDYVMIGQRIRKLRKARGLSQETLAERVDISVTHMSHIETGNTKLSLSVLVALAAALYVRTDDLLYDQALPTEHTVEIDKIIRTLDGFTPPQLRLINDVLRAVKESLPQ